ncbi:hypothetical protein KAI04_03670 [Candidatus Pacearchaeota archaeon]|nr:hypothetical protein [Candidatus Pacearchaeota archaeon]
MAKTKTKGTQVLNFIVWLTGVIVSLAVGFGLIGGTLSVPYIGIVNVIAGWVVIVTTLLGVILALLKL